MTGTNKHIPAQGARSFLFFALLLLLSVDGLFSYDDRLMSLAYQSGSAGSLKQAIQISGLLLILLGTLIVARLQIPNPFSHLTFKNYAFYLLACLPSVVISSYLILSVAAWGLAVIQFLILTIIFSPIIDKRKSTVDSRVYLESLCELCYLFLKYFLLVSLIAHITAPAYQLGEFIIKTDRFAGGTWFYWSPNLLTEFAAIVAATTLWPLFNGSKLSLASCFWFLVAISVLVMSHSRVSIFSFAVMVSFFILMGRQNKLLGSIYFILIVIGALVLLSFSSFIVEYILRGQTSAQLLAATGRVETYATAWSVFTSSFESLLIGSGFYVGGRFVVPEMAGRVMLSNVDQTLLEVAVNSGMLALAPFLLFFKDIFRGIFALWIQPNSASVFIFCLSTALLFRSLSGPTFHQLGFHLMFAVLIVTYSAFFKVNGNARAFRYADGPSF